MKFFLCSLLFGIAVLFCAIPAASLHAQSLTVSSYSGPTAISTQPTEQCGTAASPHNCSFTEWVGAWTLPQASGNQLAVAYVGATGAPNVTYTGGPTNGIGGYRLPASSTVLAALGRTDTTTSNATNYAYDMYNLDGGCPSSPTLPAGTDLCKEVVYLKSSNGGASWTVWRTDPYSSALGVTPYSPQPTFAFPNGDLIRRVNGDDLRNQSGIPYTAMMQILPHPADQLVDYGSWPTNGSGANGYTTGNQLLSFEPHTCKYQISRIHGLTDGTGRYVALGQAWLYTSGTSGTCSSTPYSMLLLVAASATDAEQGNWTVGMPYVAPGTLPAGEWDTAQLTNGDIFALFRVSISGTTFRKQATLVQHPTTDAACASATYPTGSVGCWILTSLANFSPDSSQTGHPDLVSVSTGTSQAILEFSMSGSYYTVDGGTTWSALSSPGGIIESYYYPHALAPGDGWVYVFSHGPTLLDAPYAGYSGSSPPFCCEAMQIYMQKFQVALSSTSPVALTTPATSVASTTATLNGTVNPEGLATTYHFQYGTTTSYGSNTTSTSAGSGSSAVAESASPTGLTASTFYHYRITATNSAGTTNGVDQVFLTSASGGGTAPAVVTNAATSLTSSGATLNGTVNPEGLSTTYHFDYGTTTSYGSVTTSSSAGSGSSAVAENAPITGLTASTLYHYRISATNSVGTTNGSDQTFTTSSSGGGGSYASTILAAGPVGYWRLDEASGTTAADQTANNNDGVYTGGVTLGVTGVIAGDAAASFSGTSQYVLSPDSVSLDTGDIFTAEAWIKLSALGATQGIISKGLAYYFYVNSANKLVLYDRNAGTTISTSTAAISDTTTYHYAVVTKSGSAVHLYLDNVDVTGTVSNSTLVNSTSGLYIGDLGGYFHGAIDEAALYNTALSSTTIAAHYAAATGGGGTAPAVVTNAASSIASNSATLNGTVNPEGAATTYYFEYGLTTSYGSTTTSSSAGSGSSAVAESAGITGLTSSTLYHYRIQATNASGTSYGSDQTFTTSSSTYASTILASSPVGYWRLDETSGTTASDQTANNNDGAYTNGVTLGVAGAISGNTAASFNGTNQDILIPDSTSLHVGDVFTAEAWIKLSALSGTQGIISKGLSFYFYVNSSNDLVIYDRNTLAQIAASTTAISDTTTWHYVAVTKNGSAVHLYLDGVDVTGTVSNHTLVNSTSDLYIGDLGGYFNGAIDEPAIYNTALSSTTIAAHYAAR